MTAPAKPSPYRSDITQGELDGFFAACEGSGGLTVYAPTTSPWRWVICAGMRNFQATLVSPESMFESAAIPVVTSHINSRIEEKPKKRKSFEQSKLVQWLLRAAQQTTAVAPAAHYNKLADEADIEAFIKLVHMERQEWDLLNAIPSLSAAEIRYFEQSHNAALSDIESAFLPAKLDLPAPLASFYIRYLTQARRDVEASITIAQATHSTRLPRLMADALAVGAFEGAKHEMVRHENNDYAARALQDTSVFIDAALRIASKKLSLPIDHDSHLLRLNVHEMSQIAAEIVDQHRLHPFAFLLKAKQLLIGRADVCRFPTLQRFATAVQERDLNIEDAWVQRIALAYERLFEGKAMAIPDMPSAPGEGEILRFTKKA
ncbi:MAG: hypothetical protein EB059_07780 [Alphaproteobacteria bacterium]|nr:hypothetical protein [Alphaproteobacteria bacterium]